MASSRSAESWVSAPAWCSGFLNRNRGRLERSNIADAAGRADCVMLRRGRRLSQRPQGVNHKSMGAGGRLLWGALRTQVGHRARAGKWRQPSIDGTSRMMREYQVQICEWLGMKFPGPTRHVGFVP